MQRVFRFSLVGIFAIASLTACGDKVNVQGPTTPVLDSTVHSITVTPTSAPMNIGDKLTFVASVSTGAGQKDHTVTWTSSNTTVATVDATGVVTAKAAGVTSIIATANADKTQSAAATVTVGAGAVTTITVSTINQNTGLTSVPANLANVVGQLDVTFNVDAGTARLNEVDLIMNCTGPGNTGTDTIVQKQTLASGNVAPDASESAAPITLSFNTASFNATSGAVSFKNGVCTIKGKAITSSGTPAVTATTTSTSLSLTLNNPDVIIGNMTASKTALNPTTGLTWNGGNVTVSILPVFFTPNRTPVSATVTYETKSQTVPTTGTQSVTFPDDNDPAKIGVDPINIDGKTDAISHTTLFVSVVDNNGQSFANPGGGTIVSAASFLAFPGAGVSPFSATNPFRLDTQKPASGSLVLANNQQQGTGTNSFLSGSFRFAGDSAAGYFGADFLGTSGCGGPGTTRVSNCDTQGVDSVTVIFQTATSASGTWTTVTTPTSLPETATGTSNLLRQITTDRIGNADTTYVCGNVGPCPQFSSTASASIPLTAKFGVDKTAPTATFVSGEANLNTNQVPGAIGNYVLNITDPGTVGASGVGTFAGPGTILVAQARQWNGLTTSTTLSSFENNVFSDIPTAARPGETYVAIPAPSTAPCAIGRFNAAAANSGPNALPVVAATGVTVGFCTPIPFQAGGTPAASTIPADANALNGYYVTRVLAADQAGNVSAAFNSTVLGDNSVPTVVNVDFPPTVTGNATTVFPANVTDNAASGVGDFVGSWASLVYAAGTLQYAVTGGPGAAFDGVLTNTATINPAVPNFIKNLQVSTGGAPTATTANVTNATDVIVSGQDAANNVGFKDIVITSQPTNFVGAATTWPNFTGGFAITASAATVSNGPASVTAANPTTTVITGTANGTTGIFTNPFSTTQLWYRPTGSTVWFLATATEAVPAGASTSDNGAIRTWNFAFTWNPPAATPASHLGPPQTLTPAAASTINVDVMIIGINANGDAIATPVQVITLSNP